MELALSALGLVLVEGRKEEQVKIRINNEKRLPTSEFLVVH